MDFLKLLPILFIAHQPSPLVETRVIDHARQLSTSKVHQPEYVPVYIAVGNNPPDVGALEAFYKRKISTADKKETEEDESSTAVMNSTATDESNDKSESSTSAGKVTETTEEAVTEKQTKEEPVQIHSTDKNASIQPNAEPEKPQVIRKVSQYEVTEDQQE